MNRHSILGIESTWIVVALTGLFALPLSAQEVDVWNRPVQVERDRVCDFIHYEVSLAFDLDGKVFRGENRITLTPFADGLDKIELDAEEITIETARGEGGEDLSFSQSDLNITAEKIIEQIKCGKTTSPSTRRGN